MSQLDIMATAPAHAPINRVGRARKATEPRVRIAISLSRAALAKLEKLADGNRSAWIERAIMAA